MFTGLNPTGTEATETIYKFTILGAARAQVTLKLFPLSKLRTLSIKKIIFSKTKTFLYTGTYWLQITADGVQDCRNTAGFL